MSSMTQCFRGLSIVVLLLVVAGSAVPVQAQLRTYRIDDVGTFGAPGSATYSAAYGINERGDVTGGAHDDNYASHAFLYRDGRLIDVGSFDLEYHRAIGQAVNNHGLVAGYSIGWSPYPKLPTWVDRPFLGTAGEAPFDPGLEVGVDGEAFGINDSGQMAITLSFVPEYRILSRAYWWDPETGLNEIVFPTQPAGDAAESTAWAINQRGQVAGAFVGQDLALHAYIWDPRTNRVIDLHETDASGSGVYALNDRGDAAGWWVEEGQSDSVPVIWAQDGRIVFVAADLHPSLSSGTAEEINNRGDVVGWDSDPQQQVAPMAWVAFDALSHELPRDYPQQVALRDLLSDADQAEWELWYAYGINDARQIVGYGNHNGLIRGFLMTPERALEGTGLPSGIGGDEVRKTIGSVTP
jgi:probable HAF family extracellular repeat protein